MKRTDIFQYALLCGLFLLAMARVLMRDQSKQYQNVCDAFPGAEIGWVGRSSFVVRDWDGAILLVRTEGFFSNEITSEVCVMESHRKARP